MLLVNASAMAKMANLLLFAFFVKSAIVFVYLFWPHRLTVRTPPFQGGNQSSILCGVTSRDLLP